MRTIRKFIWISFILFSCGTRTKQTEKTKTETSSSSDISKTENTEIKSSTESQTELSQYLKQSGLKINSIGKAYTLQYNGVIFSGDANLEFSDKEEKTALKIITKTLLILETETTYKSKVTYKSITTYKSMDLKSVRDSWWLYACIIVVSIGIWELSKYLFKKYNPLKYFKW